MSTPMPAGYYNRFDPQKHYEAHLFRPGAVQTAEFNELQSNFAHRIQSVGDALFRDGDVISDARVIVDGATGVTICEPGLIYLKGAVRDIAHSQITVPVSGEVSIGIYLQETVITELEDPALRDPSIGTRGYGEIGAARLKVEAVWGFNNDGQSGDFFPVYTVENGVLRPKEPPPTIDSVATAIAAYDRDNSGGTYVVDGYTVSALPDGDGKQYYSVKKGRARINGFGVETQTDLRISRETVPTLRNIKSEPHLADGSATQIITLDRYPVAYIDEISFTAEKTVNISRGMVTNGTDSLPDTSVIELTHVAQGGTTYTVNSAVRLFQGRVDWSLSGPEPSGGSTYEVTYRYIKTIKPSADLLMNERQIAVSGAVAGSLIMADYFCKLPRIDRLCLTQEGEFVWIDGVSDDYSPRPPIHPASYLPLALVAQSWVGRSRPVINDAVRMVSMSDSVGMKHQLDALNDAMSRQQLMLSSLAKESGVRKGTLVDSFTDDSMRDLGVSQRAVVVDGLLTLPVQVDSHTLDGSYDAPMVLTVASYTTVLAQEARTGEKKVNPYMNFPAPEAVVSLSPARDFWTTNTVTWAEPLTMEENLARKASETKRIGAVTLSISYDAAMPAAGDQVVNSTTSTSTSTSSTTTAKTLGTARVGSEEFMRPIEVSFDISGFGPNEPLNVVKFDGIVVAPIAE